MAAQIRSIRILLSLPWIKVVKFYEFHGIITFLPLLFFNIQKFPKNVVIQIYHILLDTSQLIHYTTSLLILKRKLSIKLNVSSPNHANQIDVNLFQITDSNNSNFKFFSLKFLRNRNKFLYIYVWYTKKGKKYDR